MENEVTENEVRKTEMIFLKYVCGMDPELINFLKTCDIKVLENEWIYRMDAWLHHKDATHQSIKDWVRRINSWLRSVTGKRNQESAKPNNKPIEVEMADNEYFFHSKKYSSLIEAAKDCGISSNSAIKYALDNGRRFVKRRSDKKIFYLRPLN